MRRKVLLINKNQLSKTIGLNRFKLKYSFLLFVLLIACVDPYAPPQLKDAGNILVVDGFLSSTSNSAVVKLSRAISLSEGQSFPVESNAFVEVQDQRGSVFSLTETSAGTYEASGLSLNSSQKYQLHIKTSGGKDYLSQFIPLKKSPPIDSVTWKPSAEGITLYTNTHDVTGNTRYYQWVYTETWEYKSDYNSMYYLIDGQAVTRPESESINTCWKSENSPKILVNSTLKLSEDHVTDFPITFIPKASNKLLRTYSILVKQRALTEEAYNFWTQLQKTTENLGGLFDPLPSQVTGNIYSTSNSSEPVLGYFNGGAEQEKRIFIKFYDLPEYLLAFPVSYCKADSIPLRNLSQYPNSTLLISGYGVILAGYTTSTVGCIDCRFNGGTTTKPDFMP